MVAEPKDGQIEVTVCHDIGHRNDSPTGEIEIKTRVWQILLLSKNSYRNMFLQVFPAIEL